MVLKNYFTYILMSEFDTSNRRNFILYTPKTQKFDKIFRICKTF